MSLPLAKIKQIIVLDAETYWDQQYTLRKLNPREYVADHRFELIGWAMKAPKREPLWITDPKMIGMIFASIDWSETAIAGHNLLFDGTILTMKYGIRPALWIDTLSMARNLVRPFTGSVSLDACARYFGLPVSKGSMAKQSRGMRKASMGPVWIAKYGDYAKDDVRMGALLVKHMLPHFSPNEIKLMDRTLRMYFEPAMELDPVILSDHLRTVQAEKEALIASVSADKSVLMSGPRFAAELQRHGVAPPTKISPQTGKKTFAFAKKDPEFTELLNHPNPKVQALVAARLGAKSTIEETRTESLLEIATVFKTLAVPLSYCGAHTNRYSGSMGINMQNVPRGSAIRKAMKAPKGHLIVAADARQIEARTMATVAGQEDKVQQFADGVDVYANTATGLYGYTVTQETHEKERRTGKVADLSLQYGAGGYTFWLMCHNDNLDIEESEATRIVHQWRRLNSKIALLWRELLLVFKDVALSGGDRSVVYRDVVLIGKDSKRNAAYIESMNGLRIWYPNPRMAEDKFGNFGFGFEKRNGRTAWHQRLHGGILSNNLIQFLAREITMEHAVRLSDYGVCRFVMQVHDELVFVVKEAHVERVMRACELVMSTPPKWGRSIPLATEVKCGRSYGDCK